MSAARVAIALASIALACVAAGEAHSAPIDSVALVSVHDGAFEYGLVVTLDRGMVLPGGASIELTGLSGVTGAAIESTLAMCFAPAATTSTSVTWIGTGSCPVFDPVPATMIIDGLLVFSSVATVGAIGFDIRAGGAGMLSGTLTGPVAVPEPATLALVAACAIGCAARRRFIGPLRVRRGVSTGSLPIVDR
jgi:hypothetical protein